MIRVTAALNRGPILIIGALGAVLTIEAACVLAGVWSTFDDRSVVLFEGAAIVAFLGAILLLARLDISRRVGVRLILGVGGVFQLLALCRPPVDSDDDYRYLWDGKVQLAGIDPYRYAPADSALAHLRGGDLFLPGGPDCGVHHIADACTRINLPYAHTIYPPVAEGMFTLVRLIFLGGGRHLPVQLVAATGALVIGALIARRAAALWQVALWTWCPIVVFELGNGAHIDWLAVLLGLAALMVAGRPPTTRNRLGAGVLLGAAIATKIYPGLLGASMLRRHPITVICSAVATVAIVYLPHVLVVDSAVLGYLPTYINQGGYGGGDRYHLLSLVSSGLGTTVFAIVVLVVATVWALLLTDEVHPESTALVLVGVTVLVGTPELSWYTLLLLALAAIAGRPEWLGVVLAPSVVYLLVGAYRVGGDRTATLAYGAALVLLVAASLFRRLQGHCHEPAVRSLPGHTAGAGKGTIEG
ncbi:MAG: DUF2029 domain-containing protein [Actinobacteria bacterium]|nr:DUF2029 domain-containing protein [Actinomycetota bacterium]